MDLLMATPAVVKILTALALVLATNRLLKRLSVSITLGAVVLAAWGGHGPGAALDIAWGRLSSANNIGLMAIIFLVVWLSSQMKETGVMRDLVEVVRSRVSQRASMAVLPAVIGLLPMPGGALFSAPLVGDCDRARTVDEILKARINYWFRHIWEYWWPLYPGVLLALHYTKLDVWQLILAQFPLSLASVAAGCWFLLRRVDPSDDEPPPRSADAARRFLVLVSPILIVIVAYAVIRIAMPAVGRWNKYLPMSVGIALAMLSLQLRRPLPWPTWKRMVFSKRVFALALLVALVRVYGAFIEAPLATESPAAGPPTAAAQAEATLAAGDMPAATAAAEGPTYASLMRAELEAWGIPMLLLVMIIPFVSGVASGLAIGFVGASFPIVMALLGDGAPLSLRLATCVLAYAFGYVGMMLSPVHICLIVTNEHFKTSLNRSLLGLVRPGVAVLAFALVLHVLLRMLPF